MNFARKKFCEIMDAVERREVATLVIAHKDRLTRFGFVWFARLCANHGCTLLVLNNEQLSPERENRLYGLRNYQKTLTTALKAGHGAKNKLRDSMSVILVALRHAILISMGVPGGA